MYTLVDSIKVSIAAYLVWNCSNDFILLTKSTSRAKFQVSDPGPP